MELELELDLLRQKAEVRTLRFMKNMFLSNGVDSGGFACSSEDADYPDLQFHFFPGNLMQLNIHVHGNFCKEIIEVPTLYFIRLGVFTFGICLTCQPAGPTVRAGSHYSNSIS